MALDVDHGLADALKPVMDTSVTLIVGFTERAPNGSIFNSAAVVSGGRVVDVYRKVFPGHGTATQPGTSLPIFMQGTTPFGIIICYDIWYIEPARVLAARGAAIVFVPTNSGHLRSSEAAEHLRPRGENLPVARAVENTTTIVVADIAGSDDGRRALGSSRIIDADGVVLAEAPRHHEALLVAEVDAQRRTFDPRGWDGQANPASPTPSSRSGEVSPSEETSDVAPARNTAPEADGRRLHQGQFTVNGERIPNP